MRVRIPTLKQAFDWFELTQGSRRRNLYNSLKEYKSSEHDGPKLLGDFQIDYIKHDCGLFVAQFQKHLERMGLSSAVLTKFGHPDPYQTLYVYNTNALRLFLEAQQSQLILAEENWPTDSASFIEKLSEKRIEECPAHKKLYDLISVVFNSLRPDHQALRKDFGL